MPMRRSRGFQRDRATVSHALWCGSRCPLRSQEVLELQGEVSSQDVQEPPEGAPRPALEPTRPDVSQPSAASQEYAWKPRTVQQRPKEQAGAQGLARKGAPEAEKLEAARPSMQPLGPPPPLPSSWKVHAAKVRALSSSQHATDVASSFPTCKLPKRRAQPPRTALRGPGPAPAPAPWKTEVAPYRSAGFDVRGWSPTLPMDTPPKATPSKAEPPRLGAHLPPPAKMETRATVAHRRAPGGRTNRYPPKVWKTSRGSLHEP